MVRPDCCCCKGWLPPKHQWRRLRIRGGRCIECQKKSHLFPCKQTNVEEGAEAGVALELLANAAAEQQAQQPPPAPPPPPPPRPPQPPPPPPRPPPSTPTRSSLSLSSQDYGKRRHARTSPEPSTSHPAPYVCFHSLPFFPHFLPSAHPPPPHSNSYSQMKQSLRPREMKTRRWHRPPPTSTTG